MRDPRHIRDSSQSNQGQQRFPLSIPPPPLPPRFPPTNTPPVPPSNVSSFPSRYPPSNLPPNPTLFPSHFTNIPSPIPSQTFHSVPSPQWSTSPQTPNTCWPTCSVPQKVLSYSHPMTEEMFRPSETTSQKMLRLEECSEVLSLQQSNQGKCRSFEEPSKSEAQSIVDSWLKSKRISLRDDNKSTRKDIKMYVMKDKFNIAFRLIRELENGARTLAVMVKTVTPSEWDRKCEEIEEKKKELMDVLKDLKLSNEEVITLKKKFVKRSKKRARLRRQAERRKKQKEEAAVKEQNLNIQIDNWQREMQEEVERIQREEDLQKQADAVLWGVTQEKTEAKRQVALLSGLLELRQVRVKRLTASGKPVSQLQIQTFDTVIERLKKMWTKLLDRCQLEEQALRGMLIDADIKADPVKTHKKLVLQEWETALFGGVGTLDPAPQQEQLVDIRCGWDQFAVQDRTLISTTVPPGWVLPVPPSSDQWRSLLKYKY